MKAYLIYFHMTQHYFSQTETELLKKAMIVTKDSNIIQNTSKQNLTVIQLFYKLCLCKFILIDSRYTFTLSCKVLDHFNHILIKVIRVVIISIALCAPMAPLLTALTVL